ncbi:MAG TPA: TetR/AcrR family transcriptional regulator [Vicinamibacteria bacterium]|nr:TetR/AcrR family transcriptional regulator [Vicinamibacteria bacterium]
MTKKKTSAPVDDRFLDAAARLFRQKGFEATTVREIARAAGSLPGSLHYRYPTKAALLIDLTRRGMDADLAAVRAALTGVADPVERLRLALRARLEYLLSRDAAQVILYDWRALKGKPREEMIRLRDRYEAFWSGLVYEAAGSGRLRPDLDLKMLRFLLLGAVNSVAQWYSPRGPCGPAEVADAFWEFLAFGVLDDAHRPSVARRRALEPALVGGE